MKGFNYIVYTCMVLTLLACGKKKVSIEEYFEWQQDESNGVSKVRTIGDLELSVKLLSPDYLAYLELKGIEQPLTEVKDSVKELYAYNLSFLLTIGPKKDAEQQFDVTSVGVANYDEYAERMKLLNFGLSEMLELKAGNKSWRPVLVEMENNYGLSFHRKFNIVFAPETTLSELTDLKEFRVTFDDQIFNTGTSSFGFLRTAIENTPAINY